MQYSINDLFQVNILIITAENSSARDGFTSKNVLIDICSYFVFAGRALDFERALRLAKLLNLIKEKEKKVSLTGYGKIFLSGNPDRYYELTDAQKRFIINNCIFKGVFSSETKDLFSFFTPDYKDENYYFNLAEEFLPIEKEYLVALLRRLGVIIKANSLLTVAKAYIKQVSQLAAPKIVISSRDLLRRISFQNKLGGHAEKLVLSYEKERLRKANRKFQAEMARVISKLRPSAGYDIESFDGNKKNIAYDRFIEVKACSEDKIRFYWTKNECNKAKELKDRYWIYLVKNLQLSKKGPIIPIMFKNPINIFKETDKYKIESEVYLIKKN
jgi:hypothetical protein